MRHPTRSVAVLSLAASLAPLAVAAQDITGDVRTSFLKSSTESCVKAASTPANLKILTPAILQKTCLCYSERAADVITGPELLAIIKGEAVPPAVAEKLKPFLEPCLRAAIK